MYLTYKFRMKDRAARRRFERYAFACNQVWNFCVATQREAERRRRGGSSARWPSTFDLINLCAGAARELDIYSDTIAVICAQFTASRKQHRKCPSFRASFGSKRSLGWVPFKTRGLNIAGDFIEFRKRRHRYWKSREFEGVPKTGAFVQDARGRWYVTIQCEVAEDSRAGNGAVGIDLGLKTLATCSDGCEVPALQHYRRYEAALGRAQRSGNKRRTRAIHAKIANARRDQLHKASTKLANENSLIVVGNVNADSLSRGRFAKSVRDAGWSMFRNMLRYKAARRQAVYIEADERFSSQTCSDCGSVSGPKGLKGLGVRRWECADCGTSHDRDVNAARMILASGRNVALQSTGNRQAIRH